MKLVSFLVAANCHFEMKVFWVNAMKFQNISEHRIPVKYNVNKYVVCKYAVLLQSIGLVDKQFVYKENGQGHFLVVISLTQTCHKTNANKNRERCAIPVYVCLVMNRIVIKT